MAPVFRFAPSPNGELHLGHALSAWLNYEMARDSGGRFLLRIEDIDPSRCRPEYEIQIYEDLRWLGLEWEEPVRRQSEHTEFYRTGLETLKVRGLVYPAFLSRSEVKARVAAFERGGGVWPRDPDGTPHYPTQERELDPDAAALRIAAGERHMWRLDVKKALLALENTPLWPAGHLPLKGGDRTGRDPKFQQESGRPRSSALGGEGATNQSPPLRGRWPAGQRGVNPTALSWLETGTGTPVILDGDPSVWGDVVLWRWDAPSSYHLSVVMDDALQGITHVVRGLDLMPATPVHRLLQCLLDLPAPEYHHHRLLLDEEDGEKLAKSRRSTGLRALREAGVTPSAIRSRIGIAAL